MLALPALVRTTALAALLTWVACWPLAASADGKTSKHARFHQRIAGLYLSVGTEDAHIFQINADGQFTYAESAQFTGFSGGPAFGDEFGTWTRAGRRELISTSLHLDSARPSYDGPSNSSAALDDSR